MPIAFALLFGLLAGGALAWVASPIRRTDGKGGWIETPFGVVSTFTWMVFAPAVAYFVMFHGDWAYLYLVPWRQVPSALDLVLTLAVAASLPASFLGGMRLLRSGQPQALIGGLSTIALLTLVLLVATSRRVAIDATYTEFHGGFAGQPVLSSALGRGVVLVWIVLAFGIYWTVQALRGGRGVGAKRG